MFSYNVSQSLVSKQGFLVAIDIDWKSDPRTKYWKSAFFTFLYFNSIHSLLKKISTKTETIELKRQVNWLLWDVIIVAFTVQHPLSLAREMQPTWSELCSKFEPTLLISYQAHIIVKRFWNVLLDLLINYFYWSIHGLFILFEPTL